MAAPSLHITLHSNLNIRILPYILHKLQGNVFLSSEESNGRILEQDAVRCDIKNFRNLPERLP